MSKIEFGVMAVVLPPDAAKADHLRHSFEVGTEVLVTKVQTNPDYGRVWHCLDPSRGVENTHGQWVAEDELQVIAVHVPIPSPDEEIRDLLGMSD